MKIAYLIPGCGVSGGIAVVCHHVNRLLALGHDAFLISETPETTIDWFPNQAAKIVSVSNCPPDIDILVATAWSTAFRISEIPAKKRFYFVQSDETRFHETGSEWEHITRLSYTLDFRFITEARWIQSWLKRDFKKPAGLVPNGLDSSIFHPAKPLKPKGNKPRILLEGAIGLPYKGMKEAFEVVSELDVEVWCVSSYGKPKPTWKCDRFFEHIPMSEMKHVYSSCDILLKLSRVEGFFGPPMEMMACGGTCVVGKVTGYDEYIVDGENALVVDPTDIEGARAAINNILENNQVREKLVSNGLKTAKNWSWDNSIENLESIYNNALADGPDIPNRLNESVSYFYKGLRSGEIRVSDEHLPQEETVTAADIWCRKFRSCNRCVTLSEQMLKFYISTSNLLHKIKFFVKQRL